MFKKIDCIKFKNDLQQQLYNELKKENVDEYYNKLINKFNKSEFLKQLRLKQTIKKVS